MKLYGICEIATQRMDPENLISTQSWFCNYFVYLCLKKDEVYVYYQAALVEQGEKPMLVQGDMFLYKMKN